MVPNGNREETSRLEVISGTISDRELVGKAMEEVTHVIHLATCKETPEEVMDVTVKGLFWLLEECRSSESFRQFVLIGGDAAMGHFFYPHPVPVTETQKRSPYPRCYALSKVLEEVMLEQYYVQYDLNGCCLRAPWIMEKDDFKYSLSFGKDVIQLENLEPHPKSRLAHEGGMRRLLAHSKGGMYLFLVLAEGLVADDFHEVDCLEDIKPIHTSR